MTKNTIFSLLLIAILGLSILGSITGNHILHYISSASMVVMLIVTVVHFIVGGGLMATTLEHDASKQKKEDK